MGYGSGYSFRYGGGADGVEQTVAALRAAMGNVPAAAGGIDDLWRRARAIAIEAATVLVEHALVQSFPRMATTGIPIWEDELQLPGDGNDEQRRQAIAAATTSDVLADVPSLTEQLTKISAHLSVLPANRDTSRVMQLGRVFHDWGSSAGALRVGLFADESIWHVRYELQVGELTIPTAVRTAVNDLMQDWLPATETYVLTDTGSAFFMDGGPDGTSHMDQTAIS
jgi:hypothetical protein